MNILLYSQFFAPSVGGVERLVESLASGLAKRGHRGTVATATEAGSFYDGVFPCCAPVGNCSIRCLPFRMRFPSQKLLFT